MLEINNLSVSLNKNKILSDLSLKSEKGTTIGILGKNGAGKTTLFNTIYGDIKFDGNILFNSKKIKKSDIGYVEAENYFYPYMLGKEYLSFFSLNQNFVEEFTPFFDLPLNEYVHNYSTGMKKKLAILSVIAMDKEILLFDEPFNGLDFESVEVLYKIIKNLKKQHKIILISSHIIETLTNTCDFICVLNNGVIESIINQNNFDKILLKIRVNRES